MRKTFLAATLYMALGLASGLFYREYTRGADLTGATQLSVLHTHLLTLGMFGLLIVLALDGVFGLSGRERPSRTLFTLFFWFYNGGLVLTAAMMVVRGILQVDGTSGDQPAVAGMAGLGHILLTVGLVHLFLALRKALQHPVTGAGAGARAAQPAVSV